jgi:hypothetical protein
MTKNRLIYSRKVTNQVTIPCCSRKFLPCCARAGPRQCQQFKRAQRVSVCTSVGTVGLLINRRDFPGTEWHRSVSMGHSFLRTKLVGERHGRGAVGCELALANHVDQFNACEHGAPGLERLKVEHRLGQPLNDAIVLLGQCC